MFIACAAALIGAACGGTPGTSGGGGGTGGGGPDAGMEGGAVVSFELFDEGTTELEVEVFTLGVSEIHLQSDRGPALDPRLADIGALSLVNETNVAFTEAAPATYSQVGLTLDDDGWGPAFAARLLLDGQVIVIELTGPITLDLPCAAPVPTDSSDTLELELALDVAGLVALLSSSTLPPASDGVIVIDETTAPSLVGAIEDWLATGWSVDCGVELEEPTTLGA